MANPADPPREGAAVKDWMDWCAAQLQHYEREAERDPLTNSVRRLANDLSELLTSGAVSLDTLSKIGAVFSDVGFEARAGAFAQAHERESAEAAVAAVLAPLDGVSFEEARAAIEATRAGVVFTAHPTFAMSRKLREAFAARVETLQTDGQRTAVSPGFPHAPDKSLSLADEHRDVEEAIVRAQNSMRAVNREILLWAQARFPKEWMRLVPQPISLATWVGYDLDGRTDIHWGETLRIRLAEKAAQLARYAQALAAVDVSPAKERDALVGVLKGAAALAEEQAALFAADFDDPAAVTEAANRLSGDDPRRLVSLEGPIASLGGLIDMAGDDKARLALCLLRAEMKALGLGAARIHLRINAAQIRSAVRADLGLDPDREFFDRSILAAASDLVAGAASRRVNLASIFLEQMTARRQFMLCSQILKHIDADAPIRFLIAESEAPATVMGAIYLARLFGVDHRLDISPLFETPDAIERGGRLVERLLAEEEFVEYIRARGRIAVQLGFSDSGRFMGQVAANLAIERLQILVARALAARGVSDIEVVLFNTHGESMGRGGYPGDLEQRFDYILTPWTRAAYELRKLRVNAESSFQGGDGFLHFQTDALAQSTVNALLKWSFRRIEADKQDRFYADINYSWDFYRGIKHWQEELFDDPDYQVSIGAFAPNLLFTTGSRKVRRQAGSGVSVGPRSLRAIPHNAILQQLGAPANVFGGAGATAGSEPDRLLDLVRGSARARQALGIIRDARAHTSLPAVRAYAAMFNATFWITRAGAASDPVVAKACEAIALHLAPLTVTTALNRFANHLAADLARLDRILLELDGADARRERYAARRPLHALHAVRQAMIMHGFMLVAELPAFSPRHDLSRAGILDYAMELRFDALADVLEEIFPAKRPSAAALSGIREEGDASEDAARGYPEIHVGVIAPLRAIHQAIREIGVGLSHFYGAYG